MRRLITAVAAVVVLAVLLTGLGQLSTASAQEPPEAIFPRATVVEALEENLSEEIGPDLAVGPDIDIGPDFIIGHVEAHVPEVIIVGPPQKGP